MIAAVVIGNFIGADHSSGTIRNTAEYLLTQFLLNVFCCLAITAIYVFLAVNILSESAA